MDLVLIGLVAFSATLTGGAAMLAMGFWVVRKKIVNPVPVYEKPLKKKHFIVPGEGGVFTLHEKRRCKSRSEADEWKREQDIIDSRPIHPF